MTQRSAQRPRRGIATAAPAALVALAAALFGGLAVGAVGGGPSDAPMAQHLATHVWRQDDPAFGGFSGIEISEDGSRFTALSDRATIRWGRVLRDDAGLITDLETEGISRLHDSKGAPLRPGRVGDSEGLAIGPDGRIWVSFEGVTRVVAYDSPDAPARPLPRPDAFARMQKNSSLEALAILPDGTLLTLPERSGALDRPFPVWRWHNGAWDQPFSVPRDGNWLPVGADIGPDGRLYLLERDFKGILGFLSRIRRFDLTDAGLVGGTVLMQSRPMRFDNLEGISVWHDGSGIRLTLVSDDNFRRFQRTEIVEFRVPD